jgi:hypothetical protein
MSAKADAVMWRLLGKTPTCKAMKAWQELER